MHPGFTTARLVSTTFVVHSCALCCCLPGFSPGGISHCHVCRWLSAICFCESADRSKPITRRQGCCCSKSASQKNIPRRLLPDFARSLGPIYSAASRLRVPAFGQIAAHWASFGLAALPHNKHLPPITERHSLFPPKKANPFRHRSREMT